MTQPVLPRKSPFPHSSNSGQVAESPGTFRTHDSLIALVLSCILSPLVFLVRNRTMLVRQTVSRKAPRTTRSAFTLLEVLVVVAIIVMLAGVGGYYLLQQYEDAKVSLAKVNCNNLSTQVEAYKLNNGNYPNSIEQLTQPQPNGSSAIVPPDKIRDPWGKVYRIDPSGPKNGGNKADVFTTTPKGIIVGNFSN